MPNVLIVSHSSIAQPKGQARQQDPGSSHDIRLAFFLKKKPKRDLILKDPQALINSRPASLDVAGLTIKKGGMSFTRAWGYPSKRGGEFWMGMRQSVLK
jgi:hypothetical protein